VAGHPFPVAQCLPKAIDHTLALSTHLLRGRRGGGGGRQKPGGCFLQVPDTLDKESNFVFSGLEGGFLLFQAGGEGVKLEYGRRRGGREGDVRVC